MVFFFPVPGQAEDVTGPCLQIEMVHLHIYVYFLLFAMCTPRMKLGSSFLIVRLVNGFCLQQLLPELMVIGNGQQF